MKTLILIFMLIPVFAFAQNSEGSKSGETGYSIEQNLLKIDDIIGEYEIYTKFMFGEKQHISLYANGYAHIKNERNYNQSCIFVLVNNVLIISMNKPLINHSKRSIIFQITVKDSEGLNGFIIENGSTAGKMKLIKK